MDILQIVGLGIIASIIAVVIRAQKPEIALQVSIVAGLVIFFAIVSKISSVIELMEGFTRKINIDASYFSTLLKIIGIAYITEFGAQICKDAEERSIASKVELAGKVIIIILAVPIITSLLDTILTLMP